jgi:hypothetical protein
MDNNNETSDYTKQNKILGEDNSIEKKIVASLPKAKLSLIEVSFTHSGKWT